MSDIGEIYKALKPLKQEESRRRKARNERCSISMLESNGFSFEVKNMGIHLVVFGKDSASGKVADFWPTTGKFSIRGSGKYQRGVRLLIKIMRGDHD